jgi:hypothetical protein
MNTHRFWIGSFLLLAYLNPAAIAAETATVKVDKVNVRGQASLKSEIVTRLNHSESVVILEELDAQKPKKGEPTRWARIQLPANATVWVFAPYIEPSDKIVNVNRLNLRSGPGENYSVLGRLERGAPVREVRVTDNWMEIEAPTNAYAFVALEYLEKAEPPPAEPAPVAVAATTPPPGATPAPAPAPTTPPPTAVQQVDTEPAPAATVDVKPGETAPPVVVTPPTPAPQPSEPQPPVVVATPPPTQEPPPTVPTPPSKPVRRIVTREGTVIYARSVQAPTKFALESFETLRTINFLHSEQTGLSLKAYAGKKVLVTGEELLDVRWKQVPIMDVQDIQLAP